MTRLAVRFQASRMPTTENSYVGRRCGLSAGGWRRDVRHGSSEGRADTLSRFDSQRLINTTTPYTVGPARSGKPSVTLGPLENGVHPLGVGQRVYTASDRSRPGMGRPSVPSLPSARLADRGARRPAQCFNPTRDQLRYVAQRVSGRRLPPRFSARAVRGGSLNTPYVNG